MAPRLSIVFVNFNSHTLLFRAIQSLETHLQGIPYEVIVVDNGSKDLAPLSILATRPGVQVLALGENRGYAHALNQGFQRARGDYLIAANPDIELMDRSLERLIAYMDEHPDVGAAVPQYLYPDLRTQPSSRRFPRLKYLLFGRTGPLARAWRGNPITREYLRGYHGDARSPDGPVDIEGAAAAFLVIRRQALQEVGPFDERFFLFAEDLDFCYRLWRHGWRVILFPEAQIIHIHGAVRKHPRYAYRSHYHRMKGIWMFLQKHRLAPKVLRPFLSLGLALVLGFEGFLVAWSVGELD